jgi:hypothetical protein
MSFRHPHFVFLLATAVAGCFTEPNYEGLACNAAAPCPEGYACTDGFCRSSSIAPADPVTPPPPEEPPQEEPPQQEPPQEEPPPDPRPIMEGPCEVGVVRSCYSGPTGTEGIGACRPGLETCTDQGWGPCTDEVLPAIETCDGSDDDCDGVVDEDFGKMTCGVGECMREVSICTGGAPTTCTPGAPTAEACNSLDDDCDGTVDEGFTPDRVDTCGVGACERSVTSCVQGSPQTCVPGQPRGEVCNGIDDDCDGNVDEGLPTPDVTAASTDCINCLSLFGSGFSADVEIEVRRPFGNFDLLATYSNVYVSDTELNFNLSTNYQGQLARTSGLLITVVDPCKGVASTDVLLQMEFDLVWSYAGPINGKRCVQITESADPDQWHDNYLCSDFDYGFSWSSAGPIGNASCTQITEPSDPNTWTDNYLCNPLPLGKTWSYAGPLAGYRCVQWSEPSDVAEGWSDNYLCF